MTKFKPQLAAKVKADEKKGETFIQKMTDFIISEVKYPVLASPKLDGIRAIVIDGEVKSRKLINIPNKHVQALLGQQALQGLDGELIVGNPCDPDAYTNSYSGVMSEDKIPEFKFYVFDMVPELLGFEPPNREFNTRLNWVRQWMLDHSTYGHLVEVVPHVLIYSAEELIAYEEKMVALGYEGVMIRDPKGSYKYGRSTLKEQGLVKVIRVEDGEYEIVGFKERMENNNEKTTDNLGRSKRSSHAENKTGRGDLGSFICKMPNGETFDASGKMDDPTRKEIWDNKSKYLGMMAKIQHRPYGGYDKPRFPVFLGFRHEMDMDKEGEAA